MVEGCRVELDDVEGHAKVVPVTAAATGVSDGGVPASLRVNPDLQWFMALQTLGVRRAFFPQLMTARAVTQPFELAVSRRELARRDELRVGGLRSNEHCHTYQHDDDD